MNKAGCAVPAAAARPAPCCEKLILEDPPFFASFGERRLSTHRFDCGHGIHVEKKQEFLRVLQEG